MLFSRVDSVVRNIVTDYDCPTDGTSDCYPAFLEFRDWAITQNPQCVDLIVPPGTYTFVFATPSFEDQNFLSGIKRLRLKAHGATFRHSTAGQTFKLGCYNAMPFGETESHANARVATVLPGSRTLQLITPAEHSKFTAGTWALLSAIDLQGSGYPSNPGILEFVQITAINTGTGLITLNAPLVNGYKSTYPQHSGALELDQGGPAKLWVLDPSWDCEHDYIGLTLHPDQGQTYANGRIIRYINCTFAGAQGGAPLPSMNKLWFASGCNFSYVEVDKIVERIDIRRSTIDELLFQSSSIVEAHLQEMTGSVVGTPQKLVSIDSDLTTLILGPYYSYGATKEVTFTGGSIGTILTATGGPVVGDFTAAGAVVNYAENGPVPWAIPGTHIRLMGPGFNVLDVSGVNADVDILTDLTAGFPTRWNSTNPANILPAHPCPDVTFQNVGGGPVAVDLSYAGAQGKPLYSYSKRTYTGNTLPAGGESGPIHWGHIVEINVNVTQAYTGVAASLDLKLFHQYHSSTLLADYSDNSAWNPSVNLKVTGLRTITPTDVVGEQSGDVLDIPGLLWFWARVTPFRSADVSGEASNLWPIVEIEIISDQGIAA